MTCTYLFLVFALQHNRTDRSLEVGEMRGSQRSPRLHAENRNEINVPFLSQAVLQQDLDTFKCLAVDA